VCGNGRRRTGGVRGPAVAVESALSAPPFVLLAVRPELYSIAVQLFLLPLALVPS
jgi:hypothetical protein